MGSFSESMNEYKKQIKKGLIQEAYQGLMAYFRDLDSHFKNKYPDYFVSGSIYYGYMDMTYFSIFPESLKRRKLKIAIVFIHDTFRFEVWLSGSNRKVQEKYASPCLYPSLRLTIQVLWKLKKCVIISPRP